MMDEWQFCESSLPLLQRCVAAAKHTDNKWHKHFNKQTETILLDSESPVHEIKEELHIPEEEDTEVADLDQLDFDDIITICLNNKQIYKQLAKQPIVYIEKLCEYIFNNKVKEEFLEEWYSSFFPVLLKRDDIKLSIDLLVKVKEKQNGGFDKVLNVIINDLDIPRMVLQELVLTMESKVEVLEKILVFDNNVFIYHLNTIYLIYKESGKCLELQKVILSKLAQVAPLCEGDKCFGRFLLYFLQVQKDYASDCDCEELQQLVDTHTSVLKMPCRCALDEIRKIQNL